MPDRRCDVLALTVIIGVKYRIPEQPQETYSVRQLNPCIMKEFLDASLATSLMGVEVDRKFTVRFV
jgi:hypothetical protein